MNYSFITDELDYRRSYEAINAINKAPASGTTNALGSTYNEWLYSYNASAVGTKGQSGFYEKPWILGNADNSTFILNTDYGYGTYDEETDKGGQVGPLDPQYKESGGSAWSQDPLYKEWKAMYDDPTIDLSADDDFRKRMFELENILKEKYGGQMHVYKEHGGMTMPSGPLSNNKSVKMTIEYKN